VEQKQPVLNLINSAPDAAAPIAAPIARAVVLSGLSRSAIYRAAGEGKLVLRRVGRSTLVDLASLRAFIEGLPIASIRPPRAPRRGTAA
jgi:hypothetical protein